MIDPKIADKVVLVTGANHGIGFAAVQAFAEQGAKVCLSYFREPCDYDSAALEEAKRSQEGGVLLYRANQQQTPDAAVRAMRDSGMRIQAVERDLSMAENIPWLFDYCEDTLGPVDILVNNHAYCALDTFDPDSETTEGFPVEFVSAHGIDINNVVNTRAYALMMGEYIRRFRARQGGWGRIINISTDAAHAHVANVSYAASKHAIESYSRSAAVEIGKYGITVNIVAPGPIQTGYLTPDEEAAIAANTPLGRVGRSDDVADVILFLASEQAHWLTGQLIYVGGGWRIHQ